MESPLQQLLQAISARCDCSQFGAAQPAAEAAEAARTEALRTPLLPDVLAILLQPRVQGCIPDAEHVTSCKQRGTAAFGRGQHRQAARLFSEALRYCDERNEEGAQLAARLYNNRALCLTKLQPPQLDAALADATSAVQLDSSFAKAWYRRAAVRRALARSNGSSSTQTALQDALQDARQALQLLQGQQADAAEAAALVEELEAEVQAAGSITSSPGDSRTAAVAAVPNGVALPSEGATSAPADLDGLVGLAGPQLSVQHTETAGRCLAAAEALPVGSDVLRERPFAHALTKAGRRSACATCLAPLAQAAAPYYCRSCPLPSYCSAACRDADAFHSPGSPECGLPWTVLLPAEAVAALRLARRLNDTGSCSAVARQQVALLSTHFAELAAAERIQLAALATVAHATWQQAAAEAAVAEAGAGASSSTNISAGDVLEALCRLQINGLAVVPPERRGGEDRQALALYPVASLMNHSCQPNVATRFQGGQLVLRTLEPLAPGEPLLHCYGPQVGQMTTAQRQLMLRQQYFFDCRCRACSSTAGQMQDMAPAGLKCPAAVATRCEGAVLPACAVPAGVMHQFDLPPSSGACCTCGAQLSQQDWEERILPDLQAAAAAHTSAMALLEQQERQQGAGGGQAAAQQAVRSLRQCLRQRQQLLHPHNLLLGATHDALAHAWQLAGSSEAAAQHLRHSLTVLQHSYPRGSTAAAFQQRQLAQALRLAAAEAAAGGSGGAVAAEQLLGEARQAEEEAETVLQLHFGAQLV